MKPALTSANTLQSLLDLDPRPGARVQLETRAPRGRYSSTLIGLHEGSSLIVAAPRSGPAINEGARLTLRLMCGNYIAAFSSRLLKVASQPYGYWHLEYPKQVEVRRVRSHSRVPVNLVISVDPYEADAGHNQAWPVTAYCADISVQGGCINAPIPLGKQGDKLLLTLRLRVADNDQVILLPARICSLQPRSGSISSVVQHSVEFMDMDEDSRLILAAFVYQQYLMETGHLEVLSRESD